MFLLDDSVEMEDFKSLTSGLSMNEGTPERVASRLFPFSNVEQGHATCELKLAVGLPSWTLPPPPQRTPSSLASVNKAN